ncbi:MAG: nucleotidyltransferase family protein [Candidatus Krumholzibacteriia bacterium]
MPVEVATLVLAAGAGRRWGGPKALARLGERTWLELAVERSRGAGCAPVVVVVGCRADEVRRSLAGRAAAADPGTNHPPPTGPVADDIVWIENPRWEQGRTGSIIVGLRALPATAAGALLMPVDFPLVRTATLRALCAGFAAAADPAARITVPVHAGHRGHPIVLGRAVWAEVMALGRDAPLRAVVRQDPARIVTVTVDDPGILRNVNTPEDLEAPSDRPPRNSRRR